jgi:lipopolysaccharide biosynthesis glycosyltransferase
MRNALVYVIDQKGYDLARHAATSFMLTQSDFCDLHVFCHNFMPDPADRLIEIGREKGVRVHLEPIDDPLINGLNAVGRLPKTTFLKFESVNKIARAYDKVLYVDHDILFFENVFLEKVDLDGFPVGAVYDIAKVGDRTDRGFLSNCRKNNRSAHYFNSGFMFFDGAKWDGKLKERYMLLLQEHQFRCDYMGSCNTNDQCAFNRLYENNWKRLPFDFNMQAAAKFSGKWARASVRHYDGPRKFLPIRLWRNDMRDIRLIGRIRKALGYNDPIYPPSFNILFELNAVRNLPKIMQANKAVAFAEHMFSEPMQTQQISA